MPLIVLVWVVRRWLQIVLADASVGGGFFNGLLGISEAFKYVPPAVAGLLVSLFSIEHIIALVRGTEVEPAWH